MYIGSITSFIKVIDNEFWTDDRELEVRSHVIVLGFVLYCILFAEFVKDLKNKFYLNEAQNKEAKNNPENPGMKPSNSTISRGTIWK